MPLKKVCWTACMYVSKSPHSRFCSMCICLCLYTFSTLCMWDTIRSLGNFLCYSMYMYNVHVLHPPSLPRFFPLSPPHPLTPLPLSLPPLTGSTKTVGVRETWILKQWEATPTMASRSHDPYGWLSNHCRAKCQPM